MSLDKPESVSIINHAAHNYAVIWYLIPISMEFKWNDFYYFKRINYYISSY